MQLRQKIHSLFSILPVLTIALTSRLIGQLSLQRRQSLHETGSASSLIEYQRPIFRKFRPKIMKGLIQHNAWQPARLPKNRAGTRKNRTTK
jgi:hypothetical protein